MAQTQEFMVSCGTVKIPARLPVQRTRIPRVRRHRRRRYPMPRPDSVRPWRSRSTCRHCTNW